MAKLNIILPEKIITKNITNYNGIFEIYPLEQGSGITVGNSLRRILLSSLGGFAISSIRIEGVRHEFMSLKGVSEDVTEIILNCKKIRFKQKNENIQSEVVNITLKGKEKIFAGDFGIFISGFKILNPEINICNIDKSTTFSISFIIDYGKGYKIAESSKDITAIGTIAIDAIYTPIKNVQYKIENYIIEEKPDYEKLILEIKTDGSISPRDALAKAAIILIEHFKILKNDYFVNTKKCEEKSNEFFYKKNLHLLRSYLSDLYISIMAKNCLKSYKMIILSKILNKQENDFKKVKHFCVKAMVAMNAFLAAQNLYFGLDISKFILEKKLLLNET